MFNSALAKFAPMPKSTTATRPLEFQEQGVVDKMTPNRILSLKRITLTHPTPKPFLEYKKGVRPMKTRILTSALKPSTVKPARIPMMIKKIATLAFAAALTVSPLSSARASVNQQDLMSQNHLVGVICENRENVAKSSGRLYWPVRIALKTQCWASKDVKFYDYIQYFSADLANVLLNWLKSNGYMK